MKPFSKQRSYAGFEAKTSYNPVTFVKGFHHDFTISFPEQSR
jgi:hypothetical protein